MDQSTLTALITAGGGGAGLLAFLRWALMLWAQVRREAIVAAKEAAALAREDNERRCAAMIEQAKASTLLAARFEEFGSQLGTVLDAIQGWHERPLAERRRRARDANPDERTPP